LSRIPIPDEAETRKVAALLIVYRENLLRNEREAAAHRPPDGFNQPVRVTARGRPDPMHGARSRGD